VWVVSDEALLAGLASGDPDAAAAFVRRFQRRVFGLAFAVLGDARSSEDVAQEAFVRAWRHAGAFDPRRGTVSGWLLAVTRNLAVDAVRVRRATVMDPAELLGLGLPSDRPGPDDEAASRMEAGRLRAALADLPEAQRRALVLAAFGGRTAREIGELEGIPLGTAKTRVRSALLRLRALLVSEEAQD